MKRSIVLAVVLVLIVGFVAGGEIFEGEPPVKEDYWDNLPEAWKFNFTTFGQFGAKNWNNANFQIAGFVVTKKSGKRFYKETWPEQKSLVEDTVEEFDNPMLVYVDSYGNSSEPFDPTNFTFSQHRDSTEYSLTPDRITGFDPGEEVTSEILEVPEEIDVKESFFIHYRYDSAQVYTSGPFTESPYLEEESEAEKTEEEKESQDSVEEGAKAEVHVVANLSKVEMAGESPEPFSEEIQNISGTASSRITVTTTSTGDPPLRGKCSGFVKYEAGKLIDRYVKFSDTTCTVYEGSIELAKGLVDFVLFQHSCQENPISKICVYVHKHRTWTTSRNQLI